MSVKNPLLVWLIVYVLKPYCMDKNMTYQSEPKIGIFDSGVGGFSVLKEIRDKTSADVLYYGDCARAPYGNRSIEEICMFMEEIIHNLKGQEVTHFVSACNSMSVNMTDKILKDCGIDDDKYVDMIRAFKNYSKLPTDSKVVVFGTKATIFSGAYQEVLSGNNIQVEEYIFKTLAGLIEKKEEVDENEIREIVLSGVMYAKEVEATHVLYGCTHYPLIDDIFKKSAKSIDWGGTFIDPAIYVGMAVSDWKLDGRKNTFFEASEVTEEFRTLSDNYAI